ncbi:DUF402 domain-containing protein [Streptomyces sp. NPDC058611]|uniref:DUF402 domain-containing protein n=1 Tax=unclassified Streptomyces TaxID=2593676 RepID=UPI0036584C79
MREQSFGSGETVVRRDMHRGRVWSAQAQRVITDTKEALVTACAPGAEVLWPALYARTRTENDATLRMAPFDELASGEWELTAARWQETELLLWKPPEAWFSVNAFYTAAGLRNWYVNFERPTCRTRAGFDTFDLAVDLVIGPGLDRFAWKDEDEYAHVRRLGVITDAEHREVEAARGQVLAMLADRTGVFATAELWASWRWDPGWPTPRLPPATA